LGLRSCIGLGLATLALVLAGCWDWTRPEDLMHEDAKAPPDSVAADLVLDSDSEKDAPVGDARQDVVRDGQTTDAPVDTKPLDTKSPDTKPPPDTKLPADSPPDTKPPDTNPVPDAPVPDAPVPDTSQPDLFTVDTVPPDTSLPDAGQPDGFICSPLCTNACAGGICVLNCAAGCTCPPGHDCQITCPKNTCSGDIDCKQAKSCTISCAENACAGKIQCGKSSSCYLKCGGAGSCKGDIQCEGPCTINCTMGCGSKIDCTGGPCDITCATGACMGTVNCSSACSCKLSCSASSCSGGYMCPPGCTGGPAQQVCKTIPASCDTC
jgi:hypothetical protein